MKPLVVTLFERMAKTYAERNRVYGDNYRLVGPAIAALFPKGVKLRTAQDFELWHLFELIVVKLSRFAQSGLRHQDSVHDIAVYAAIIESLLIERAAHEHTRHRQRLRPRLRNRA